MARHPPSRAVGCGQAQRGYVLAFPPAPVLFRRQGVLPRSRRVSIYSDTAAPFHCSFCAGVFDCDDHA